MARAGAQEKNQNIIQPGTTLQLMERGFGKPGVQQNSPGMPHCQALDACGTFSAEGKSRVKLVFVSEDESKFNQPRSSEEGAKFSKAMSNSDEDQQ